MLIAGYVLLATAAFVAAAWWPPSFALFVACAAGAIAIALGGLAHAYFMDRGRPVVLADELAPAGTDAWLVVLLSRLWPGLGHLAQGQWLPGIAFALGTFVVASVLVRLPALLGILLYAAYGIVPAVLAYRGCTVPARGHTPDRSVGSRSSRWSCRCWRACSRWR